MAVSMDALHYERELWNRGVTCVAGIDEVGRGPLAGPVMAAAVILQPGFECPGLTDSKKLTATKREQYFLQLTQDPRVLWSLGSIDEAEIDRVNILQATWKAMVSARDGLVKEPHWVLVDGHRVPPLGERQTPIIKGDSLSLSIAAASVIAKVTRDRKMIEYEEMYPGYGFAGHKGYGTEAHLKALQQKGPTPIHRKSFEPVRQLLLPGLI